MGQYSYSSERVASLQSRMMSTATAWSKICQCTRQRLIEGAAKVDPGKWWKRHTEKLPGCPAIIVTLISTNAKCPFPPTPTSVHILSRPDIGRLQLQWEDQVEDYKTIATHMFHTKASSSGKGTSLPDKAWGWNVVWGTSLRPDEALGWNLVVFWYL